MHSHRHVILHKLAKFRSNQLIVGGVMTSYPFFFKMAAGSHIGFDLDNVRPPTKCNCRSQLVLKFGVDAIFSFGDIAIFSERELMFMFAICRRPSVCLSVCLSVVCL